MLKKTPAQKSGLEQAIDQILNEMQGYTCDEDEYNVMSDQLVKLYALKALDKPDRICKDTLALIAGNIIIATIIVAYEQKNIITTKAGQFLLKIQH